MQPISGCCPYFLYISMVSVAWVRVDSIFLLVDNSVSYTHYSIKSILQRRRIERVRGFVADVCMYLSCKRANVLRNSALVVPPCPVCSTTVYQPSP